MPGKHLLRLQQGATLTNPAAGASTVPESVSVKLSEAVSIYLRLKVQNRPVTFHRAAERSCCHVIGVCGDKDLLSYTKADATSFRDALIERGLAGSSMTRIFGTVRSVVNFAASEVGLDMTNPFAGVLRTPRLLVGRSHFSVLNIRDVAGVLHRAEGLSV